MPPKKRKPSLNLLIKQLIRRYIQELKQKLNVNLTCTLAPMQMLG